MYQETGKQWTPSVGVVGGGSTRLPDDANRVLVVDEMTRRLSLTNTRLVDLITATRQHADSLFGSQPESGQATGPLKAAPTRLAGLGEAISAADELVSELYQQVERLRGI